MVRSLLSLLVVSVISVGEGLPCQAAAPLNGPSALAVDAKGFLYVANQNANQVLVYGPNLSQAASRTISNGVVQPDGLAVDLLGNLYVENMGPYPSISVNLYPPTAQPAPTSFIQTFLGSTNLPIAVDSDNNLLVCNGSQIIVYPAAPVPSQEFAANLSSPCSTIASRGGRLITGNAGQVFVTSPFAVAFAEGEQVAIQQPVVVPGSNLFFASGSVAGLAFDAADSAYIATSGPNLVYVWPDGAASPSQLFGVQFTPAGIAVDRARGRIFLSDFSGNMVAVYDLSGNLIRTLN